MFNKCEKNWKIEKLPEPPENVNENKKSNYVRTYESPLKKPTHLHKNIYSNQVKIIERLKKV